MPWPRSLSLFWSPRHRFLLLFIAILMAGLVGPLTLVPAIAPAWVGHGLSCILLLAGGHALWPFRQQRRQTAAVLALAGLAMTLGSLAGGPFTGWGQAGLALALLWLAIRISIGIWRARRITAELVFAAICVYLLLGVAWAHAYLAIELLLPGSFLGLSTRPAADLAYYSFVIITTLGIGDITASHALARLLTALEATAGFLFIAVMIGRTLALELKHQDLPPDNQP